MPTGLKNSPDFGKPAGTNVGPRAAICDSYQIVFANTNQPINFPSVIVPLGCSVSLRGVNGGTPNLGVAFAARYPVALQSTRHATITPDTEVSYPADNLNEIWAMGTAADGLVATIRGNPLG